MSSGEWRVESEELEVEWRVEIGEGKVDIGEKNKKVS